MEYTIDFIDQEIERLFKEGSDCCSKDYCICKVTYLQHRRNEIRLKDKEYQALPEK